MSELPGQSGHALPDQYRQVSARKRHMQGSKQHHDDHLVGESRAASTELQTECPGGLSVASTRPRGPFGKRLRRYLPGRIVRRHHLRA
jgi:hypothetical protein